MPTSNANQYSTRASAATHGRWGRSRSVRAVCLVCLATLAVGCGRDPNNVGRLEKIWGRRGVSAGRLQKPRAMAIDRNDEIYLVDMRAKIQVFDTEGKFLRGWATPTHENGRPTGLSIDVDGNLLVADTHYYQLLIYNREGDLLRILDGSGGKGPGGFEMVLDGVQDSKKCYYVSEMGEFDRIQKFSADGEFLLQWGGHGSEPGQFVRPQNMAIDEKDQIWVADACNHRIQVFDTEGNLVRIWGTEGSEVGQLYYPYDIVFGDNETVYVVEYGNHRVQKFTLDGQSLGCWGTRGRGDGQLFNPWALVRDSRGKIHVLDSNNHRVQRIDM